MRISLINNLAGRRPHDTGRKKDPLQSGLAEDGINAPGQVAAGGTGKKREQAEEREENCGGSSHGRDSSRFGMLIRFLK
jgi:hypothetical protein